MLLYQLFSLGCVEEDIIGAGGGVTSFTITVHVMVLEVPFALLAFTLTV
ncbi:MAG: hypothetical protein ACE5KT_11405 [Methanosarcinales archaeon]